MLNTIEKHTLKLIISSFKNIKTIKYKISDDIFIYIIIYQSNVVNYNLVMDMKSSIAKVLIPEKEAN